MDKTVILCVLLVAYFAGVLGQVGSLCRPNERLLQCGCPRTCREPEPDCRGVCREGCFCDHDQVRNDEGICVDLADCPPLPKPYKLETSEPRAHGGECPPAEEWRYCEPCNRTCDNPNPICPAQCASGCFCKGDLLRDKDGRCVKFEKCSNFIEYIREREKNVFSPIPYRYSCGPNQKYNECQKCVQTCSDPEPVCGRCRTGCFCKDGMVKGPDGRCIEKDECPKVHFYWSVEDCGSGEEFYLCGACEPSCRPGSCPAGCVSGCQCRPPTLRHASGLCVTRDKCQVNCTEPNEEYSCLFGCEPHCDTSISCDTWYPRPCILRCHCKRGWLRNEQGFCVRKGDCSKTVIVVE